MKFPFVHTVNLFMQKRKSFGHQGTRFTKGQFISKGKTTTKISALASNNCPNQKSKGPLLC